MMSRYEATVRHADKFAGPTAAQVLAYNARLAVAHAESSRQYRTGPRYGQQLARTVDAIGAGARRCLTDL
jgi:hypothetical protein